MKVKEIGDLFIKYKDKLKKEKINNVLEFVDYIKDPVHSNKTIDHFLKQC